MVPCLNELAHKTAPPLSPSCPASGAQAATPGCHCKPFTQLGAARLGRRGYIHTAKGNLKQFVLRMVHVFFANVNVLGSFDAYLVTLLTLKPAIATLCSCKLQRETERRAARTARSELESSSSASLSSSPSQLPPSRGHLNRVPEHESGDCFFCSSDMCVSRHCILCAAICFAAFACARSFWGGNAMLAAYSWRTSFDRCAAFVELLEPAVGFTAIACFTGVKLCTSCQRTKPLEKFYTAGRHKGGSVRFHSHCKSCKLENEAAQRMQPRKGGQEAEMSEPMTSELCLPCVISFASTPDVLHDLSSASTRCSDMKRSRVLQVCHRTITPSKWWEVNKARCYSSFRCPACHRHQ